MVTFIPLRLKQVHLELSRHFGEGFPVRFIPGFWRKCRIAFRCVRFTIWGIVLLALGAFAWFNLVGLPGFLKTRLVTALHERGVDLEFSRMRVRLVHGLVCDNVRIGAAQTPDSPVLAAREVQLRLDLRALLHRRAQVNGLVLRDGTFTLPFSPTNALALTNLQAELRFQADDTWSLDHFRADLRGVKISLAGTVAHAPETRNWKLFAEKRTGDRSALTAPLRDFSDALEKIRFTGSPQLNAWLTGDARDVHSFALRFNAVVPDVRTPWFAARDWQLTAALTAPADAPTNIDAAWDFWTNAQPFQLVWRARAAELHTEKINADAVMCAGTWHAPELAVSDLTARLGHGKFSAAARLDVATRVVTFTNEAGFDPHILAALLPENLRPSLAKIFWSQPPHLRTDGALTLPAWTNRTAGTLADLGPTMRLRGELACTNATAAGVTVDFVRTHFAYSNLVWRLPEVELAQGKTKLKLSAEENDATKDFSASVTGVLAAASVKPFLPADRLAQLDFPQPLALELALTGNLNDLDRLAVTGKVALTNFTVRGQTMDFARTHFAFSNHVWRLAEVELAQGRTKLTLNGELDQATKIFSAQLSGALDAASVRLFLPTSKAQRGFGLLTFHEPLALDLDVTGSLREFARLAATGHIALTNFAIRDQTVDSVVASLAYTNLTLEFFQPRLVRAGGAQQAAGDKVTLDFAGQKLFLANATGNVEPTVVVRAIGPKTAEAMEPYQFPAIPTSRVNGCIPLRHDEDGEPVMDDADLRFDVVGTTPFRWRKFATPAITGTIHWLGHNLILTNAVTECYGGEARGWAGFDLQTPGEGTDFNFHVTGSNVDFHRMGLALWSPTNQLEGSLSGTVTVTSANSGDWRTWNGLGALQLRDGMLWNVPVFGLLSPMLNVVSPGLGNNRAKDAAGSFTMTNGVIRTDALVIHAGTMRLNYNGTVDLEENVNARVTADFLRNTPLLGPLVSLVFTPVSKAFECEVTGTLSHPKVAPVYVPKLLLVPLHPIRTMEELFLPSPEPAGK